VTTEVILDFEIEISDLSLSKGGMRRFFNLQSAINNLKFQLSMLSVHSVVHFLGEIEGVTEQLGDYVERGGRNDPG